MTINNLNATMIVDEDQSGRGMHGAATWCLVLIDVILEIEVGLSLYRCYYKY